MNSEKLADQPGRLLGEDALGAAVVQVDDAQELAAVADRLADHGEDQQPQHARPLPRAGSSSTLGCQKGSPEGLHLAQDRRD